MSRIIVKRAMKLGIQGDRHHGPRRCNRLSPDANHAVPPDSDFKIIYGVEAYLVDDLRILSLTQKDRA